jgi:hypothetical protein
MSEDIYYFNRGKGCKIWWREKTDTVCLNKNNQRNHYYHHHQPIDVPTAGAQAFLMDYT